MNKLKSFTIIELMVVMLISTLVMGIAYQGYMLFYKQFLSFKSSSERIAKVSLLDRLVSSDMSDCKVVIKRSKGMDCVFNNKVIQYEWEENFVLRKQETLVDTFYLTTESVEFNFLTLKANEGQLIDELVFREISNERHKNFHYAKQYGADILVNNP